MQSAFRRLISNTGSILSGLRLSGRRTTLLQGDPGDRDRDLTGRQDVCDVVTRWLYRSSIQRYASLLEIVKRSTLAKAATFARYPFAES